TVGKVVVTCAQMPASRAFVSSRLRLASVRGSGLRAPRELARLGVDLHLLAFLDEERHPDRQPGFEGGELGNAAARGVAAHAGLGGGHRELHVRRELKADRPAVVALDLYSDVVDEQLTAVADHAR